MQTTILPKSAIYAHAQYILRGFHCNNLYQVSLLKTPHASAGESELVTLYTRSFDNRADAAAIWSQLRETIHQIS
jgi:hypothetical protein